MTQTYEDFLEDKAQLGGNHGFDPLWMPDFLYPFQRSLVEWNCRKGRSATFADCGLGKTPMQLVWAQNVAMKTTKPVLILTPLAVAGQTVREAAKFELEASQSRDGKIAAPICVANYERLHYFNPDNFGGVVCDESSILKNFDGVTRAAVTDFMRKVKYRLLCTATAAPNDYIELGTSSEAIGELGYMDMLGRFFKTADSSGAAHGGNGGVYGKRANVMGGKFRFRGHAEHDFWRWVCSWARAVRKPSDLGFDDSEFTLPPLETIQHIVKAQTKPEGFLFDVPASTLAEQRNERRRSLTERCEKAASLVADHDISIAWCNLNDEADLLEELIPNSIQISGNDSDDKKEMAIEWFLGEKCICQLHSFRSKLAVCGKSNTPTAEESVIKQILRSVSVENLSAEPLMKTGNTCAITTLPISTDGLPKLERNATGITPIGDSNTAMTPNSESKSSPKPKRGKKQIPKGDSLAVLNPLESLSKITNLLSQGKVEDALSVARQSLQTNASGPKPDGGDSMLTTATQPGKSEDYSAPLATSDSDSSKTIPKDSTGRQCMCGHQSGIRRLVSKPSMLGLGLNFQHCAHQTFFPSHSFEQWYQAIRRSWRFGQKRPVKIDVITSEGEARVLENLQRKAAAAEEMFSQLVALMNDELGIKKTNRFTNQIQQPSWLS